MFVSLVFLSSSVLHSCDITYQGTILTSGSDCPTAVIRQDCTAIGESAFAKSNVENVDCSAATQLTEIRHRAFIDCSKLKSIMLPESLITIGSNVFRGCTSLQKITIPQSVTFIGFSAFKYCTGLSDIEFKSPITVLPAHIFSQCKSITEIKLPSSITKILPYAFANCECLQKIKLPPNLEIIGNNAFDNTKIRKITIPSSVKSLGSYLFRNCPWLESVSLPDSIRILPAYIFVNTPKLYWITIPKYLAKVDSGAFQNCAVRELNFPDTLTEFSNYALNNCNNLQTLRLPSKFPKFGTDVFTETRNICLLKVDYSIDDKLKLQEWLTSKPFDSECLTPLDPLPAGTPDNYGVLTPAQIAAGITEAPILPEEKTDEPGSTTQKPNNEMTSTPTPKGDDLKGDDPNKAKIIGISVGVIVAVAVVAGIAVGVIFFIKKSKVHPAHDVRDAEENDDEEDEFAIDIKNAEP